MISKKTFLYSFTLIFISCLFLFILGEVALRVYYKDSVLQFHLYDTFRTHRLNPDYKLKSHPTHLHSKDGFRSDKEFSLAKPEGTIRIIMLGGSALYGLGSGSVYPKNDALKNSETIPSILQDKINASFIKEGIRKKVEIINAGVIGYQTFQHLIYLNQSLLSYRPDWIINFDGNNDFYGENPNYSHWNDYTYGSSQLIPRVNRRDLFTPFYLLVRFLGKYSYFFSWTERFTNDRMDNHPVSAKSGYELHFLKEEFSLQNFETYANRTFIRALWQINRLGELEKYKHFVIIQPQIVFEKDSELSPSDLEIKKITLKRIEDSQIQKMKRMNAELPSLFQKHGVKALNLGSIAGGKEKDLYWDYCHLSPNGSEAVAERIYQYFYPQVKQ